MRTIRDNGINSEGLVRVLCASVMVMLLAVGCADQRGKKDAAPDNEQQEQTPVVVDVTSPAYKAGLETGRAFIKAYCENTAKAVGGLAATFAADNALPDNQKKLIDGRSRMKQLSADTEAARLKATKPVNTAIAPYINAEPEDKPVPGKPFYTPADRVQWMRGYEKAFAERAG